MYIDRTTVKTKKGKKPGSILLRHSYRTNGKVKKKTIANLSSCSSEEINAIELALKHKKDLTSLGNIHNLLKIKEGKSVGSLFAIYNIAKSIGIEKALGKGFQDKLSLYQIISRIIEQGSRLFCICIRP